MELCEVPTQLQASAWKAFPFLPPPLPFFAWKTFFSCMTLLTCQVLGETTLSPWQAELIACDLVELSLRALTMLMPRVGIIFVLSLCYQYLALSLVHSRCSVKKKLLRIKNLQSCLVLLLFPFLLK